MPIGIIGIKKNVIKKLDKNKKKIFFGGTFSGNSINTFIANRLVRYVYKNKKNIFDNLDKKSEFIQKEINLFLKKNNIDAKLCKISHQ